MEPSGSSEAKTEKNFSKLLLAGDPRLCEILQEKLLQQYARSDEDLEEGPDQARYLTISNKYFLSNVVIDLKKISGEDNQEEDSGYMMMDDDIEEDSDPEHTQGTDASNRTEPQATETDQTRKNQIHKEPELSSYDCVVVVHDPKSSPREYDQIC